MTEVFTSDHIARSNIAAFAIDLPPIPHSVGLSARISVLSDIGTALKNNGANLDVISQWAAYDQSTVTQRINDISAAVNALSGTPSLPIFTSTDYNSFSSIINNIVAVMATLP